MRVLIVATVILISSSVEARAASEAVQLRRLDVRDHRITSGVALTRARGFMYWGQAAANLTGFRVPVLNFFADRMGSRTNATAPRCSPEENRAARRRQRRQ